MIQVEINVPLAFRTTLGVGGGAAHFVKVKTEAELTAALAYGKARDLPVAILGGGSNVVVPDEGVSGLVIEMGIGGISYTEERDGEVVVRAGAGVVFDDVVAGAVERGLWGLENLSHIPGTVGGTPIQNVGAYGVEVSELIELVETINRETGEAHVFKNIDCTFGYRNSFFKSSLGRQFIVTAVTFRLHNIARPRLSYADLTRAFASVSVPELADIRAAVIAIRSKKFPDWRSIGTAGSFFKNPIITKVEAAELHERHPDIPMFPHEEHHVKCSLGFILDKLCGLRGFCVGPVCLYKEQALVLTALPGSTAKEIDAFANDITSRVRDLTGIVIEREVTTLTAQK